MVARNTEYRAGRYEVNMLGNPIVRNRSVMQVLDLLPGLRVSGNTLFIKGTPVSVVYIDDRLVTDLGELSALRAEDVKSVEVQNKTGAAYSATTSGGIVRIRLKKLAAGSFYGNVSSSASVSRDGYSTGLALPFSAQCGRLGIYICVGFLWGERNARPHLFRISQFGILARFGGPGADHLPEYPRTSEPGLQDKRPPFDRSRGTDFHGSERPVQYGAHDLCGIGLGRCAAADARSRIYALPLRGHALQPAVSGVAELYLPFRHVGFPALFQGRLPAPERRSELRLRHARFSRPEDAEPFSTELRRERYKLLGHLFASRLDLNKNFSEERSFSAGLSYDLRYADNNAPVHRFEEEEWIPDPKMSTWFIDRTQSTGAYTQWADAYGKFSYQAGLRLQWDRIAYRNAENTGYEHRDYWRLFPELSLAYTFNPERAPISISTSIGPAAGCPTTTP